MFVSTNPATGQSFASYALHDGPAMRRILDDCAAAFAGWRDTALAERCAGLLRLAGLFEARVRPLAELATREMGKLLPEAEAEVRRCARVCRFYARMAPCWLADAPAPSETGRRMVVHEPLGVILAVMPWNFPFWQVMRAAAPILAAGNALAVKHAPNVTGVAMALEGLFTEAGFPPNLLRVLRVDAVEPVAAQSGQHSGLLLLPAHGCDS